MLNQKIHPKDDLRIKQSKLLADIQALRLLRTFYKSVYIATNNDKKLAPMIRCSIKEYLQDDIEDKEQQLRVCNRTQAELIAGDNRYYNKAVI